MTFLNSKIVSASSTPADIFSTKIVLTPENQSNVMLGATVGNGSGTNLLVFGDNSLAESSVSLSIPGSTTKLASEYTTDLTWILSNTPV